MTLNADCSSAGSAVAIVKTPPSHGTYVTTQGEDFSNYPKENQRFACNLKPSPSTLAYYTSNPGYKGSDVVVVSVIYAGGGTRVIEYRIDVEGN